MRSHLNRLIYPREEHTNDIAFIMWTTTRHHDMVAEHWEPNHFEPVLLNQSADNQEFIVITGEDPKMDEVIEEREPSVETNPNMADNVDKQEFDVTTSKDQHTDDGCMADNKETYVKTNADPKIDDVTGNQEPYVNTNKIPKMDGVNDNHEHCLTSVKDHFEIPDAESCL